MGDFNDVTKEEEKKGGNGICRRRVYEYTDCMDFCNLLDLGFSGSIFTWTNKRDISGLIQQRLDRVWANSDWKASFPEAMVRHLARINSDHFPLLLSLTPNLGRSGGRPFRFQPIWLSHESFSSIVKDAWEGNHQNINGAIISFIQKAKAWNKDVFGNIFWKKKNLIARILGVENALGRNPSQRLINLHMSLSEELGHILGLEEELWGIKARTDWLIQGERNTKFFHMSTLIRRSGNRIHRIQDSVGNWEDDPKRVQRIFLKGFTNLYRTEQVCCPLEPTVIPIWGNRLTDSEAMILAAPPSDAEILFTLNTMKPFKAPGPDGLHAGFFQRFWMVVGNSVKFEVKRMFRTKKIPQHFNKTLIALIPKQTGPETINHFRPISLCNTIYKIVTKILVQRMKHLMPTLISPSQTAFISGRRGTDNVIVAQELVYTLGEKERA
ncbi:hypothetical protein SO802_032677 [Lithocarpus litseifolius]|uniref:Reverse transcriptase domain-containing protein n=1 Tax=Lithocarpus litseifolius TaxID=425828 RepID=A0AAW2BDQ9_9ROSI